jgi:predicted ribosome quality control (RQC) complex YloA/Tae2 family protein
VFGVTTQNGTTAPVVVSTDGQLGTVASSERFKKDIATMDKASEGILSLRPVTFHYKSDTKSTPQFGLVAEEVAKVNPDLVMRDKNGEIYTVRYDAVNAMLLNEFLKEHDAFVQEQRKVQLLEKQVEKLTAGLQKVSDQLEQSKAAPQAVVINQ